MPSNEWGWNEILLNGLSHRVDVLSWQLGGDSSTKPPEVWLPPFIPKPKKKPMVKDSVAMGVNDLRAFLNKPRVSDKVKTNEQ